MTGTDFAALLGIAEYNSSLRAGHGADCAIYLNARGREGSMLVPEDKHAVAKKNLLGAHHV
ncbi:hypothetical protein [Deinococcus pimensis]|uniref:hypothetical protein n=1 Tax=Deinococcus pimensis TaxID=309888 RepID=UPI00146FB8D2|nr:hypothetical protein [Deinococcus pimensis]